MDTKHIIMIMFVVSFIILFVLKDISQRFFVIMIIVIVGYTFYKKQHVDITKNRHLKSLINRKEKELSNDFEVPENNIFQIHKTPRNLKYIKRHKEFMEIIYDLRFLNIYDQALYNKFVSYLEYFLKIHFKIMIGKYEVDLYIGVLKDIRAEILNIMKTIYFNIPNISTILYIDDLDEFVEKRIKQMQALTYKLLKVLGRKYKKQVKPPFEFDMRKDNHYALF